MTTNLPPTTRSLHLTPSFAICCGTITLDIPRRKLLLIRHTHNHEVYLPKGHKDIGETLEAAAVRETYEETGVKVNLLPLSVRTNSTKGKQGGGLGVLGVGDGEGEGKHTEPIAVQQRTVRGKLKIIVWFVASADEEVRPDEGTREEGEDFEREWVGWERCDVLSFEDDREIVRYVIGVVEGQGGR